MSESPQEMICCCGSFPIVPFYDVSLSREPFRIETVEYSGGFLGIGRKIVGGEKNYRVVQVPFFGDSSRRVVAVSPGLLSSHYVIQIYDVNSKQRICQCVGHRHAITGLASLSSATSFSSNPFIVSGGYQDKQVLVFDALKGTKLCSLPYPPYETYQIVHFPEWKNSDFFVGGDSGSLCRYDLERQQGIGRYKGHSGGVWGISASISRNLLFSATAASSASVRVWSRDDYNCQEVISLSASASSCYYVDDKGLLCVGLHNGRMEVRDIRQLKQSVNSFELFRNWVNDIARVDEDSFVFVSSDHTMALWNLATGNVRKRVELPSAISGVCVLGFDGSSFSGLPQIHEEEDSEGKESEAESEETEFLEESELEEESEFESREEGVEESETETGEELAMEPNQSGGDGEDVASLEHANLQLRARLRDAERELGIYESALARVSAESDRRAAALEEREAQRTETERRAAALLEEAIIFRSRHSAERTSTKLHAVNLMTEIISRYDDRIRGMTLQLEDAKSKSRVEGFLAGLDARLSVFPPTGFLAFDQPLIELGLGGAPSTFHFSCCGRSFEAVRVVGSSGDVSESRYTETVVLAPTNDRNLRDRLTVPVLNGDLTQEEYIDACDDWRTAFRCCEGPDRRELMRRAVLRMIQIVEGIATSVVSFFGGELTLDVVESSKRLFDARRSVLLAGLEGCGVLRHRSLCFKYLCDLIGLPCRLNAPGVFPSSESEFPSLTVVRLGNSFFFPDLATSGQCSPFDIGLLQLWDELGTELSFLPSTFSQDYENAPRKLLIGGGGFSNVFGFRLIAESGEARLLAVKELNLTQLQRAHPDVEDVRAMVREAFLLETLWHKNVIRLIGWFSLYRRSFFEAGSGGGGGFGERDELFCLVMKAYNRNGLTIVPVLESLPSLLRTQEILVLLISVANGLRYLHSRAIWHLDLKPGNVLIDWDSRKKQITDVRLCDFGGAHDNFQTTVLMQGTPGFCAPELATPGHDGEGEKKTYDERADIFSFGAFLNHYDGFLRSTCPNLVELAVRCRFEDPTARPSLLEILFLLRENLMFVDQRIRREQLLSISVPSRRD